MKEKSTIFYSVSLMIFILLATYFSIIAGKIWLKWDVYSAAFPLSVAISDALMNGQLPLWEPFSYRGVPLSHLIGVSVWSPVTIILGFFGFTQYLMQIQYIILILLAAVFMYMSIFQSFRNPWISMVAGVAYATCGQFVSNAEHLTFLFPMVIFPLLHFSYKKWVIEQKYKWSILIGICFGLLILNNYPPFLFMSAVFILVEYLFQIKILFKGTNKFRLFLQHFRHFLVAIAVACLSGFVSIVTTFEIITQITRGELSWELATASSLNHWYWLGAFSPMLVQVLHSSILDIDLSMNNVYIALPIVLLVLSKIPKRKNEIFMIVIIIIAAFTAMGKYGPIYKVYYELVPSIDSFKFPTGFRYIFFYYVTLYASYILHELIIEKDQILVKQLKRVIKWTTISVAFLLGFLILLYIFKISTVNIPRYSVMELIGTVAVLLIIGNMLSSDKRKNLFLVCSAIIIFSFVGVLRNSEYTIGTPERPESYKHEIKAKYNNDPDSIQNKFTEPTPVNIIGHKILTQEFQIGGYVGSFELNKFREASDTAKLPNVGDPVIFAVNEGSVVKNDNILVANREGTIIPESIKYSPNKFEVELVLDQPSYVILEQTIFKGWIASVNNKQIPIHEFDGGVMGIKVNQGVNKIVFEFKPILTIISAWVTFTTWIMLAFYGVLLLIKRQNRKTLV